jgi:Asp/Glu/hydantoin racemase
VAPTGAEIAADPEAALALLAGACRAAVTEHGASSVILGGAGLAGIAGRIAGRVPVPLIDSLAASVALAETLVRAGVRKAATGAFAATPAVETVGLSPALARRFAV